jgi:hypothetical protein
MKKTIKYKDGRDETKVFAGLNTIGSIIRVDGGWVYKPEVVEGIEGLPVFGTRQLVKQSLTFKTKEEIARDDTERTFTVTIDGEVAMVSGCCAAEIIDEDICSQCREHCDPIPEGAE